MNFETYARSKSADYAAFAETVGAILKAALGNHPDQIRLQQLQHRAKEPDSLFKKLLARGAENTEALENEVKDLAGCRLVFYSNSDVARFLGSGIVQDNFDVDWDRTKIHHPVPGQTAPEQLFISNNYVVKLKEYRTALAEYSRFKDLYCEVQVQTILNHAWSEMTHDVIYKAPKFEGFGASSCRRFNGDCKRS
jgi:ppGpp synthetase/RelA/SpoT-type nucleotidyltranferase